VTLKGNAGEVKDERTNTYWRSTLCGSPHSFIVKGKIDKLHQNVKLLLMKGHH